MDRLLEEVIRLPATIEEAARLGIEPDPELARALEEATLACTNLSHGISECRLRLRAEQGTLESKVAGLVGEVEAGIDFEGDLLLVGACEQRAGALELLIASLEVHARQAEEREVDAKTALLSSLTTAIGIRQRELKNGHDQFAAGSGERPVCSARPGQKVKLRCQSCSRLMGSVDYEKLLTPLTSAMFVRLDGRGSPFDSRGTWRTWRCPSCGCGPIKDARWLLTESWQFIAVSPPVPVEGSMPLPKEAEVVAPPPETSTAPDPIEAEVEVDASPPKGFLSRSDRDSLIFAMRDGGFTERAISKAIGVSKSSVHDILARGRQKGESQ